MLKKPRKIKVKFSTKQCTEAGWQLSKNQLTKETLLDFLAKIQ